MKIITHKEKHYIQTEFGYREILATTDKSLKIYESENLAEASGFSLKTNDIYLPQLPESFIQAYIKAYNEGKQIETVDLEMEFTEMGGHNIGGGQIFGHWNKIKTRPDNTVVCHQSKMYSRDEVEKLIVNAIQFGISLPSVDDEKQAKICDKKINKWISEKLKKQTL